jgi:Cu+-exporting ATPase
MNQKLDLQIQGMNCASCVNRIEKNLQAKPGIQEVRVNLTTESARVLFDDTVIQDNQIMSLINGLGYKAHLPKNVTAENPSKETRELYISLALTFPLVLPMVLMPLGIHLHLPWWIQLTLASPVQFYFGARFYKASWSALKTKSGTMDQLVVLGTSASFILSLVEIFSSLKNHSVSPPHLYFEACAMIITMILFGKHLEKISKKKTNEALNSLEKIRPLKAMLIQDGKEKEVDVEELKIGDLVLVKPGTRIPADGIIQKGFTSIDESLITGESLPVEKKISNTVYSGSINGEGAIEVKLTAVGEKSLLGQIIDQVHTAQSNKAPIEKLIDRVSSYFVPFVLICAILTLLLTGLISGNWPLGFIHSIAVLVIACPCAMGLATPTSIVMGTGLAAKSGILIKDPKAFELAHKINTVIFDKTGTLTEGKPQIASIYSPHMPEDEFLKILGSLERTSSHPLSKAILTEVQKRSLTLFNDVLSENIPGMGLKGKIEGELFLLTGKNGLSFTLRDEEYKILSDSEARGESVSALINESTKKILGLISFHDPLKSTSVHTISLLKKMGIRTILLSGDNHGAVQVCAKELGVDEFYSEVLPTEKSTLVMKIKGEKNIIAMVGDGINDGAALASADVSMAMGSGADVAIHSSDITLVWNNPLKVIEAIEISKKTYSKIKQNLFWAFFYNIAGIPLAALGYLSPTIAGAAMALSSSSVVGNSLLLKNLKGRIKLEEISE